MAFTYLGTLSTNRDKVRFYIGDKELNAGPLPDNDNFSDSEIDGLLTAEGSWERAVAACFEILAARWATYTDISLGPRSESFSQISARFAASAASWRKKYGYAGRSGVRHPTRIDGYSSTVSSDEV